jgi:hypothetical protein
MKIQVKLAGAVSHYNLFKLLKKSIQRYQGIFDFTVYDAPNLCKWNAGRVNRDITITPEMVRWYNDAGIGVAFTFTNDIIDVTDPVGIDLLEMLDHNPLNSIILINDDFREFLRSAYPEYKLTFSITGHPNDISITDKLLQHYLNLESKYDVIVPRFEMTFNSEFLSAIDSKKYEPITNDTCIYGCNILREHFVSIADKNRMYDNPWVDMVPGEAFKVEECWIKHFDPDVGSEKDREKYGEKLGMDFTKSMYTRSLKAGYCRFKVMGRELGSLELRDEILYNLSLLKDACEEI